MPGGARSTGAGSRHSPFARRSPHLPPIRPTGRRARPICVGRISRCASPRWGFLGRLAGGIAELRLEILDYPGEWLLDLPLLRQSYREWSHATLDLARRGGPRRARAGLARLSCAPPGRQRRRCGNRTARWRTLPGLSRGVPDAGTAEFAAAGTFLEPRAARRSVAVMFLPDAVRGWRADPPGQHRRAHGRALRGV